MSGPVVLRARSQRATTDAVLDLLHAWILYLAVLALSAYGLGLLVERACGQTLPGMLLLPLGLITMIFLAAVVTVVPAFAPATTPIAAILALIGLALGGRKRRPTRAPTLALIGVILAYGAPVILSGHATFAGYIRLDDTASWLTLSDQILAHGRSLAHVPDSSFRQLMQVSLPVGYPAGAFPPLGITAGLSWLDAAWAFAPYVAFCGAMVAASMWVLIEPLGFSNRRRAVVVFAAAQPALLYGYVQWGGIKEVTVAFGVIVLIILATRAIDGERPGGWRTWIPLAIASGAMLATAGPGGVAFVAPVVGGVGLTWLYRGWRHRTLRTMVVPMVALAGLTILCAIPIAIELSSALDYGKQFLSKSSDYATRFGNLRRAVRGWQLGGVWAARDFRSPAAAASTVPMLVLVGVAAAGAIWATARRKITGLPLYVALGLLGALAGFVSGASPWLMGKTLAIASPAVPLAALCGAALLITRRRRIGLVVAGLLVVGIVVSNVLQYSNVTLAPRDRLAELQTIGNKLKGHGPTFDNEYEVYATRHFLRRGAPVQPAELRTVTLPLLSGHYLIKSASADIDSFPPTTLAPYNALVVQRTPTMSVPSSQWDLAWAGRFYALYFRSPSANGLVRHVPLGDSRTLPYCGNSQDSVPLALCSVQPIATPTCRVINGLGRQAAAAGASLVAETRPAPVVLRGDDWLWPGKWLHDTAAHTLTMTTPGTATSQVAVAASGTYELWLGGTFSRGLKVTIDGKAVGTVRNELAAIGGAVHLTDVDLTAGTHRFAITYPGPSLRPGEADLDRLTMLASLALQQTEPAAQRLTVPAAQAQSLCGRPLDWIDFVR